MMSDEEIVAKLLEKDIELTNQIEKTHGESNELYELLQKKYILYNEGSRIVSQQFWKVILGNAWDYVANKILTYKVKKEFEEQIGQIVTRLDDLEKRIKKD